MLHVSSSQLSKRSRGPSASVPAGSDSRRVKNFAVAFYRSANADPPISTALASYFGVSGTSRGVNRFVGARAQIM